MLKIHTLKMHVYLIYTNKYLKFYWLEFYNNFSVQTANSYKLIVRRLVSYNRAQNLNPVNFDPTNCDRKHRPVSYRHRLRVSKACEEMTTHAWNGNA